MPPWGESRSRPQASDWRSAVGLLDQAELRVEAHQEGAIARCQRVVEEVARGRAGLVPQRPHAARGVDGEAEQETHPFRRVEVLGPARLVAFDHLEVLDAESADGGAGAIGHHQLQLDHPHLDVLDEDLLVEQRHVLALAPVAQGGDHAHEGLGGDVRGLDPGDEGRTRHLAERPVAQEERDSLELGTTR